MALKQPIRTTTTTALQRAQLQLPDPSTFDILPKLHELLARVDAHQTAKPLHGDDLHLHDLENTSSIATAYDRGGDDFQPLNPKDLPNALVGYTKPSTKSNEKGVFIKRIKDEMRDALRSVERLPDVDRTVEEQEEEIDELEERIRQQRQMLRGLAGVAKQMEPRMQGSS